MTEDDFDTLIDDATHAVNNLIPDRLLDSLGASGRSDLLIRINDALSPILRELADTDAELSDEDDVQSDGDGLTDLVCEPNSIPRRNP